VLGETNRNIETLDLDGVLERDWNTGKRALQIDLVLSPMLSFRKQNLGSAVCLVVCLERYFGVGAQDVDGVGDTLVDILDEVLDGLAENGALL
jgi:hypothetical protein